MSQDQYTFLVGTVVGFHGLRGDVKIKTSTNSPEILLDLSTVRVEFAKGMKPIDARELLTVRDARIDRRLLVMSFEQLPDRTAVEALEGAKLYCREEELGELEEEEFWVRDLVGCEVFTTDGARVGLVKSIIPSGNDLLEISPDGTNGGKTILVPFVKDLVPTINMKSKRIEIIAVPGLLEAQ